MYVRAEALSRLLYQISNNLDEYNWINNGDVCVGRAFINKCNYEHDKLV